MHAVFKPPSVLFMKNYETLLLRKQKEHFQQGDFLSVDFYQPTFSVIITIIVFPESISDRNDF